MHCSCTNHERALHFFNSLFFPSFGGKRSLCVVHVCQARISLLWGSVFSPVFRYLPSTFFGTLPREGFVFQVQILPPSSVLFPRALFAPRRAQKAYSKGLVCPFLHFAAFFFSFLFNFVKLTVKTFVNLVRRHLIISSSDYTLPAMGGVQSLEKKNHGNIPFRNHCSPPTHTQWHRESLCLLSLLSIFSLHPRISPLPSTAAMCLCCATCQAFVLSTRPTFF